MFWGWRCADADQLQRAVRCDSLRRFNVEEPDGRSHPIPPACAWHAAAV